MMICQLLWQVQFVDMFPHTVDGHFDPVEMFPVTANTYDVQAIFSTHVETIVMMSKVK